MILLNLLYEINKEIFILILFDIFIVIVVHQGDLPLDPDDQPQNDAQQSDGQFDDKSDDHIRSYPMNSAMQRSYAATGSAAAVMGRPTTI